MKIPKVLKKRVMLLVPLLSLSGILEVASLAALIPLVGLLLEPNNTYGIELFLGSQALSEFERMALVFSVFLVIIILKGIYVFLISKFTFNTALLIKGNVQKELFNLYLNRSHTSHLESNSANYIRNITTESHQIEGRFIMPALTLLAELLPVIFISLFLLYINPQGVLFVVIVFSLSGFLITKFTSTNLKKFGVEQLHSDGMQIKVAKESFASLKEISLYKCQVSLMALYSGYVNKSLDLIGKALALGQIPRLVLEVMGLISIAIIASISFYNGATANQVMVELAIFVGAIVKLLPSSNRIVMNLQSLTHAKPSIENILNELKTTSKQKKIVDDNVEQVKLNKLESIVFENVGFKYNKRDNNVFENINIEIKRGQIIGLIGETGAGKSTFIDLLLGFITATQGSVFVNGFNIHDCLPLWQSKIGYVPQDVVLFDDSLKNNILFYEPEHDDKRLQEILTELKLGSLIDSLPDGLNTSVGENGSLLSGGQKQRIGIARALIKNPELIIFDEATSALDIETEKSVNKLIIRLKLNCIILIIAHKKSALEDCDEVYQIKDRKLLKQNVSKIA